jgi:hypothetical protein
MEIEWCRYIKLSSFGILDTSGRADHQQPQRYHTIETTIEDSIIVLFLSGKDFNMAPWIAVNFGLYHSDPAALKDHPHLLGMFSSISVKVTPSNERWNVASCPLGIDHDVVSGKPIGVLGYLSRSQYKSTKELPIAQSQRFLLGIHLCSTHRQSHKAWSVAIMTQRPTGKPTARAFLASLSIDSIKTVWLSFCF